MPHGVWTVFGQFQYPTVPLSESPELLALAARGAGTDKLMLQSQAGPQTVTAYRDTFTLLLSFLAPPETDGLIAAPDRTTWTGQRDHALLLVAIHTGLRVSESTGLTLADTHLGPAPTSASTSTLQSHFCVE